MDPSTVEDPLQGYLSSVSMPATRYQEPPGESHGGMVEDLRFHMLPTNYSAAFEPVPAWYSRIKPEETYPGYELPEERMRGI